MREDISSKSAPLGYEELEQNPHEGKIEGAQFATILTHHYQLVWSAAVRGLAIGIIAVFMMPNQYKATTSIMPPDQQQGGGAMLAAALSAKANLGGIAGELLGAKNSSAVFIGILRSNNVLNRIVDRFQLKHVYHTSYQEDARIELMKATSIEEDRKAGIISIQVHDRVAERAALIAHAYVDELNAVSVGLNTSAAHKERVFIEERLRTVKRDLDVASKDLSDYSSKNVAIDIKEQAKAMVEGAAAVQGELITAKSELSGLKAIYTDSSVRVKSLRARIAELERQLEKIGGIPGGGDASNASSKSSYPSIRELPGLGLQYAELYRRQKIQETIFELLTQQYELAKIQEAKEVPVGRVLDEAQVPEKIAGPPRVLISLGCAIFAAINAFLWIWGRIVWKEIPELDERKVLIHALFESVKSHFWGTKDVIVRYRDRYQWQPKGLEALNQNTNLELDKDN